MKYVNNIIKLSDEYVNTKEYMNIRRELFDPTASHIFSQIVSISDSYYNLKSEIS